MSQIKIARSQRESQILHWSRVTACLLLAYCPVALRAQPAPSLEILVDPAPANQSFPAVFSIHTSVGSLGMFQVESVTGSVLTMNVDLSCMFICPGPSEYRSFPFDMPPLPPGNYTVNFVNNSPFTYGSFAFSVDIGVSAEQPLRIYPEEPEAYSPFRIEALTGDSATDPRWRTASATVKDKVIVIEHREPGSGLPGIEDSVVTSIQGLPPGDYTVQSVRRTANGTTVVEHEDTFSVAASVPEAWVYMFYHPQLQHYFMTADELEVDAIYWGPSPAFVSEWDMLRNDGFLVWPADGPAPAAAAPVCRFYSPLVNSHFHTADENECAHLKQYGSGWDYEGIAFQALVPTDGACFPGTIPVWRLYNGRAKELDTNHRFTIHAGLYRALIHEGWLGEGVVFCSPIPEHGFTWQHTVAVNPTYPLAGQQVSAVLEGHAGHSPFGPSNIQIEMSSSEILINANLNTFGFAVGSSYLEQVPLGTLAAGSYTLSYVGDFGGEVLVDKERFTVFEDFPTVEARTFHHAGIDHFFVTAGENEVASILADGWHSTDSGFNVWPVAGPAPAEAEPVCRFYSALVNSHFYTASADECEYLTSFNSGWSYEGIAFQALVPDRGVCPAGTNPVWRLFNNRHWFEDSNHRFVASASTYRTMISEGWAGEGIAFCSPL